MKHRWLVKPEGTNALSLQRTFVDEVEATNYAERRSEVTGQPHVVMAWVARTPGGAMHWKQTDLFGGFPS